MSSGKLIPVKGSLGIPSDRHFYCDKCFAIFDDIDGRIRQATRGPRYVTDCHVVLSLSTCIDIDFSKCIYCQSANKIPTPKATLEQIVEKKEQIKTRLNKGKDNGK